MTRVQGEVLANSINVKLLNSPYTLAKHSLSVIRFDLHMPESKLTILL